MHARRSHVVVTAVGVRRRLIVQKLAMQPAPAMIFQRGGDDFLSTDDAGDIGTRDLPIERHPILSEGITLFAQHHATFRIWHLLGHVRQKEDWSGRERTANPAST